MSNIQKNSKAHTVNKVGSKLVDCGQAVKQALLF